MGHEKKKSILLVEDEAVVAMAEKASLERLGYEVVIAGSGEEAIGISAVNGDIDLILMDIDLGKGIDGTEAAGIILKDRDIPVVFLSSHGEPEVVEKTEKITSYGYVSKTSGGAVLHASMKMAFRLFEANRKLKSTGDKLAATLDALPDLLFEVGLDGYYWDIHSPHEELLFRPASELIGRRIPDILPPEISDVIMSAIREANEKGFSMGAQYRLDVPAGARWFEISVAGISGDPGDPHFIFLGRDITERKRTEEALEKRIIALTRPLENAESVAFDDLFNLDDIQRVQDDFSKATGVASIITGVDGTPITAPSNFCRLCSDVIRKTAKGDANCRESDAALGRLNEDSPTVRPCLSGGLWDAGAGISVGGRHIANWLIGQVRDGTQSEAGMIEYARSIGADERAFLEAFHEVPVMAKAKFDAIAQALYTLANQLSAMAYQNVQQARFITERRLMEEALRASEAKYRLIAENTRDVLWVLNLESFLFSYVSPSVRFLTGFTSEEALQLRISDMLVPESLEAGLRKLTARLDGYRSGDSSMMTSTDEVRQFRKDGSVVWVEMSSTFVAGKEGKITDLIGVSRDIDGRKAAEGRIMDLLAEKELILREVHHRIKNNMATIKGFLSLQAATLGDQPSREALDDAGSRIQSMMVLYDKLYQSAGFADLSVKEYLETLVDEIVSNFPGGRAVTIEKRVEDFPLDVKKLQPVGIIMNELVTNIMKHAFAGRDGGIIAVSASLAEGHAVLAIGDDGIGLPESVSIERSTGFGLTLVKLLADQLRGSIRAERDHGTRFVLEFDL